MAVDYVNIFWNYSVCLLLTGKDFCMLRKMASDCVVRPAAILGVHQVRLRLRPVVRLARCHFSTPGSDARCGPQVVGGRSKSSSKRLKRLEVRWPNPGMPRMVGCGGTPPVAMPFVFCLEKKTRNKKGQRRAYFIYILIRQKEKVLLASAV